MLPAAAVEFSKFCATSICCVASLVTLIVAGVIVGPPIVVFVATAVTLVRFVAAIALVAATGDYLHFLSLYVASDFLFFTRIDRSRIEASESTPTANPSQRAAFQNHSGSFSSVGSMDKILIQSSTQQQVLQIGARDLFPLLLLLCLFFCVVLALRMFELLTKDYLSKRIPVFVTNRSPAVTSLSLPRCFNR